MPAAADVPIPMEPELEAHLRPRTRQPTLGIARMPRSHPLLRWLVVPASLLLGCDGDTTDDGVLPKDTGWFEMGVGEISFTPLEDGGDLPIVWGSQGAAMFPLPLRAGNFVLPEDPSDYTDEKIPMLSLRLDVEGHNDGVGDHFKQFSNYPITFEVLEDDTYAFFYVRVIVPDDIDADELDGLPAHLWVQLEPWNTEPLTQELDLTVRAPQ
jgi:hypothetical protein